MHKIFKLSIFVVFVMCAAKIDKNEKVQKSRRRVEPPQNIFLLEIFYAVFAKTLLVKFLSHIGE